MPKFPVQLDKPVKFAFGIKDGKLYEKQPELPEGGTAYYEFEEINDMPIKRYGFVQAYFRELSSALTKDDILAHLDAMEKIINSPNIQVTKLVNCITQLRERASLVFEPETVYKMACVLFFDETENPYEYSSKKEAEKIKVFKSCPETQFFFLRPLSSYIPFSQFSEEDLTAYLEEITKLKEVEKQNLLLWAYNVNSKIENSKLPGLPNISQLPGKT